MQFSNLNNWLSITKFQLSDLNIQTYDPTLQHYYDHIVTNAESSTITNPTLAFLVELFEDWRCCSAIYAMYEPGDEDRRILFDELVVQHPEVNNALSAYRKDCDTASQEVVPAWIIQSNQLPF